MTFSWNHTGSGGGTDVAYKYTGKEQDDSTGLYFDEARYYDPVLGRFISADTIVPGALNPQALNRYAYAANNPILYNDPSGHCPWCVVAVIAVSAVAGGVQAGLQSGWDFNAVFRGAFVAGIAAGVTAGASAAGTPLVTSWGSALIYGAGSWSFSGVVGGAWGNGNEGIGLAASLAGSQISYGFDGAFDWRCASCGQAASAVAGAAIAGRDPGAAVKNWAIGFGIQAAVAVGIEAYEIYKNDIPFPNGNDFASLIVSDVDPPVINRVNRNIGWLIKLGQAAARILGIGSRVLPRPKGIPKDWIVKPSKKGGGTRYVNPNNHNDSVRVSPGNPNSLNPSQRAPYVQRHKGNTYYDKNGNPVERNSPESHIPYGEFKF